MTVTLVVAVGGRDSSHSVLVFIKFAYVLLRMTVMVVVEVVGRDSSHFVMVIINFAFSLLRMTGAADGGRVRGGFFALRNGYC